MADGERMPIKLQFKLGNENSTISSVTEGTIYLQNKENEYFNLLYGGSESALRPSAFGDLIFGDIYLKDNKDESILSLKNDDNKKGLYDEIEEEWILYKDHGENLTSRKLYLSGDIIELDKFIEVLGMNQDEQRGYIAPSNTGGADLGLANNRWNYLYASGIDITENCISTASNKNNESIDEITCGLDLRNSNICGVNSIYFYNCSDNGQEGISFPTSNDTSIVDTIWAKDGALYFTPSRTLGNSAIDYKVFHQNFLDVSKASEGILDVAFGGTGAETKSKARGNLLTIENSLIQDLESTSDGVNKDTVESWGKFGTGVAYIERNWSDILEKPEESYGLILNVVKNNSKEVFQIWKSQPRGCLYYRGGNANGWQINNTYENKWRKILDEDNYSNLLDDRYLQLSGGIMTGTLFLNKGNDVHEYDYNSPALVIGGIPGDGDENSYHMELDGNEILAKNGLDLERTIYLGFNTDHVRLGRDNRGDEITPMYLKGGALKTCSGRTVPGLQSKTTIGNSNYQNTSIRNDAIDVSFLSYWNGAYNGQNSNLTYCAQGPFGTIVTKNQEDYSKRIYIGSMQDFHVGVVGLFPMTLNSDKTTYHMLSGRLTFWRNNGLYQAYYVDIIAKSKYNDTDDFYLDMDGNHWNFSPCTFMYNGKKWAGLRFWEGLASYSHVTFNGEMSTNVSPILIDFAKTNNGDDPNQVVEIYNQEVYNSISYGNNISSFYYHYNPTCFKSKVVISSDSYGPSLPTGEHKGQIFFKII